MSGSAADRARLPNGDRAVVDSRLSSEDHESGKHKARVFAAVLGLRRQDAEWLRDRLLEAATTGKATLAGRSRFGALYVVDFWLTTPSGSAEVRSGWIMRSSEDFHR